MHFGPPAQEGPEPAAEIFESKKKRERAGEEAEIPEEGGDRRDDGTIEQAGENETFRVHPATDGVEHADPGDEHPGQAEKI